MVGRWCGGGGLVPRLPPPALPGRGRGTEFPLFGHKVVAVVVVVVVVVVVGGGGGGGGGGV